MQKCVFLRIIDLMECLGNCNASSYNYLTVKFEKPGVHTEICYKH